MNVFVVYEFKYMPPADCDFYPVGFYSLESDAQDHLNRVLEERKGKPNEKSCGVVVRTFDELAHELTTIRLGPLAEVLRAQLS